MVPGEGPPARAGRHTPGRPACQLVTVCRRGLPPPLGRVVSLVPAGQSHGHSRSRRCFPLWSANPTSPPQRFSSMAVYPQGFGRASNCYITRCCRTLADTLLSIMSSSIAHIIRDTASAKVPFKRMVMCDQRKHRAHEAITLGALSPAQKWVFAQPD